MANILSGWKSSVRQTSRFAQIGKNTNIDLSSKRLVRKAKKAQWSVNPEMWYGRQGIRGFSLRNHLLGAYKGEMELEPTRCQRSGAFRSTPSIRTMSTVTSATSSGNNDTTSANSQPRREISSSSRTHVRVSGHASLGSTMGTISNTSGFRTEGWGGMDMTQHGVTPFQSSTGRIFKRKTSTNAVQRALTTMELARRRAVPFAHRSQLIHAKRVVIKLGSAVVTRADGCGIALGRLASIVEQVAELQNQGKECLLVTSGAVAFGRQRMTQELVMSMSMRETLSKDPKKGFASTGRIFKRKTSTNAVQRALTTMELARRRAVPFAHRSQLIHAKRVVIKLGSAVVTRADGCGIALGRLASIVEQVAELQNQGKECLLVTSGAVAFGRQRMTQELVMSMSMRETLSKDPKKGFANMGVLDPRAAASVGQSGLMSLYEAMFGQYGAKVLVTVPDFHHDETRKNLYATISELINLNILPIVNTNDAVSPPASVIPETAGVISIKDNDSLAARLAVEVGADLLIIMSDVNGVYDAPPEVEGSRLLSTFSPHCSSNIKFGDKSSVGTGGMDSKVKAATWALERGVSVVVVNGTAPQAIQNTISGRKVGTFFTDAKSVGLPVETLAQNGSRILQSLTSLQRSEVLNYLGDLMLQRQSDIMDANKVDLDLAEKAGLDAPLLSRLAVTPAKLQSLAS
ncbi:unnamed protein product, partial [Notodromas monacha]